MAEKTNGKTLTDQCGDACLVAAAELAKQARHLVETSGKICSRCRPDLLEEVASAWGELGEELNKQERNSVKGEGRHHGAR